MPSHCIYAFTKRAVNNRAKRNVKRQKRGKGSRHAPVLQHTSAE